MVLLAVVISAGNALVARTKAEIRTLTDRETDRLFPPAKIVEENGRFRVTVRSRFNTVAEVAELIGLNQLIANEEAQERHQITFESFESGALQELIDFI